MPSTTQQARMAEASIKRIKARYAMGQEILKQCGDFSARGEIGRLADKLHVNRDTAQKLRALANRKVGYTKRELNKWFKLFRQQGRSLTISHFIRLVSVPKGPKRDQLTQRALQENWSGHRLQVEILARHGRRRAGGRRPRVITGKAFQGELQQTLWAWSRWLKLHLESNEALRPEVTKQLRAIQRLITKLDQLVAK